jgi:hypothetical protein
MRSRSMTLTSAAGSLAGQPDYKLGLADVWRRFVAIATGAVARAA